VFASERAGTGGDARSSTVPKHELPALTFGLSVFPVKVCKGDHGIEGCDARSTRGDETSCNDASPYMRSAPNNLTWSIHPHTTAGTVISAQDQGLIPGLLLVPIGKFLRRKE
jgi:hypothetical protein